MKTLSLFFKPSSLLAIILSLFSVAMLLIILMLPIAWAVKLGITLLGLLASIYAVCKSALLLLPGSITQLDFNNKNELTVKTRDGHELKAVLLASSFVSAYLTVLNLKLVGSHWQYHVLILPDSLSAELFRQLRVRLLWSRHPAVSVDAFADDLRN